MMTTRSLIVTILCRKSPISLFSGTYHLLIEFTGSGQVLELKVELKVVMGNIHQLIQSHLNDD
jgi:hypothetical protein